MESRKRRKWTDKLRKYVVKQALARITPIAEIARNRNVSRRSIYMLLRRYKSGGWDALTPKKPGRKTDKVNPAFEKIVVTEWYNFPRGAHKILIDLRIQGYGVSERKIQKILRENNLKMNKRKRPSQIKFTKYEWPRPNMLWHTDWTDCPFTGKKLIAFIDDHSRFVTYAAYYDHATTENTLLAFQAAIAKCGKPGAILTDNGAQFTPARGVTGPFTQFCEAQNIKHILGRVHHPQTNGKIERWFGTYKLEYQPLRWTLDEYVEIYNFQRRHQGIGYSIPHQRYVCN
jgi:putative transposase